MTTGKWLVPAVLEPVESVCVQLQVPKDIRHIAAFWGALNELTMAWNWEDSYGDGSQVAYLWRDIIEQAVEDVRNGENCQMTLNCNDVEACLATSAIIAQIQADIATNQANIAANVVSIATNQANIASNLISIGQNAGDIMNLTNRVDGHDIDIQQHNLTLADHETRITTLENSGGGGGSGDKVKITPFIIPSDTIDTIDTSGLWVNILGIVKSHTFTYDTALIVMEFRARSSGTNSLAYFRIDVDGVPSTLEAIARGVDAQSMQVNDTYSGLKGQTVDIRLQMKSGTGDAVLIRNQNIMCFVIEYGISSTPISDTVTFDAGGMLYTLPLENNGTIQAIGNPDNCLAGDNLTFGEPIAVEIDFGSVVQINGISADVLSSDAPNQRIKLWVDGTPYGTDADWFTYQSLNNQWESYSFPVGFFPVSGQVVHIEMWTNDISSPMILQAMDNIFVDTA